VKGDNGVSDGAFKYWAFISYSHRDKAWGDWLHRRLETYRVPGRLAGRPGRDGAVPKRLFPVFRDREELPSSADLSNNISDALQKSRYLIVICSPQSAVSRWVNEEIFAFKRLGRADRILALVVDGEPNASDHPESGALECFPAALRHTVSPEGALLEERVEPIAADARSGKDGKANSFLKLAAGLLGVAYDELRQRERQRVRQRRLQWAAATLVAALALGGLLRWQSHRHQAAADEEQGRQALLGGNAFAAAAYLSAAYDLGDGSPSLRFMLARALAPLETPLHVWKSGSPLILAAFNPDGTRVLGVSDAAVQQWDSASGRELSTLKLPPLGPVEAVFSPSGHLAAVGFAGGGIEVYDLQQGRRTALLHAATPISRLAFDPDETRLLSVSRDNGMEIFSLAQGRRLAAAHHPGELDFTAEFSRDGKWLLTRGDDGKVRLWDAATGRIQFTLASDFFDRATFDREQPLIRTRNGRHVELWDLKGRLQQELPGPAYTMNVLSGIPPIWTLDNGRRYLMAGEDGVVTLVDGVSGSATAVPLLADKAVEDVAATATGFRILVRESAGVLAVRDPYTALPLAETLQPIEVPRDERFDAGGTRVLVYDKDTLLVWETGADQRPVSFAADANWGELTPGQWSPDGSRLSLVAPGGALALYDFRSARELWRSGSCPAVSAPPVFDQAGARLAAGCRGNAWWVVDAKTGAALHAIATSEDFKPWVVAFSRDGRRLLYLGDKLSIWDLSSWKALALPSNGLGTAFAAFTPNGRDAAVFSLDSKDLRFYDLDQGRQENTSLPWRSGGVEARALSPDGRWLTLVTAGGTVERWDLQNRLAQKPLKFEAGYINESAVSNDASRVLVVDEHSARILDGITGATIATLEQRAGEATLHERSRLADVDEWDPVTGFSPNADFLLAAAGKGLGVWDASDGRLLTILGRFPGLITSASLSPDGLRAGASDEASLRVWDTGLETRRPSEVDREVRCHVPWRVVAGGLEAATPAGCGAASPPQ